jgi:hypothetical protein
VELEQKTKAFFFVDILTKQRRHTFPTQMRTVKLLSNLFVAMTQLTDGYAANASRE